MYIGDTDSIKLKEGYDKSVIDNYNKEVEKRIEYVSKVLDFPIEMYKPKDQEGIEHMLGVFDFDGFYTRLHHSTELKSMQL